MIVYISGVFDACFVSIVHRANVMLSFDDVVGYMQTINYRVSHNLANKKLRFFFVAFGEKFTFL